MSKNTLWGILALILLVVFALQIIGGEWNNSATYDEVAHLPAGYAYITKGDFRFNPEHPPFVKMLAALPLLLMKIPPLEKNPHWDSKNEWQFGRYFLYHSGLDADRALFLGRLMMLLLSLCLAVQVFQWSKELYGMKAALFSLFLFTFEPNIISNSQIIHTDLGFSLFMTSTLYFLWKALRTTPSTSYFILAGLCFGFALATKFTALVLVPISFGLVLFYFLEGSGISFFWLRSQQKERASLKPRFYFILFALPLFLLAAVLILSACYGFSSTSRYLDGFLFVLDHNQKGNSSYLFGMYSDFGWWYYFPLAFLIKTPLPIIIFSFLSLFLFFRDRFTLFSKKNAYRIGEAESDTESKPTFYAELYLLFPALLFFFLSLFSRINIGVRHILPIYPLIIIFSGRCIFSLFTSKRAVHNKAWFALIFMLAVWLIASSVFIFPHHLSYFNELVLGPKEGYKYLVDSNLDWGQDLIRLKKFLNREGENSLILSYNGSADPYYYGIKYKYLPGFGLAHPQDYQIKYNEKEFIALSATNLQSVFFNLHDTYDWLKEKEPYARVGYSLFIWEISGDLSSHQHLARIYREFGLKSLSLVHEQRIRDIMRNSSK